MFNQYHKGFDEYRKSEYFKDRAATARETASQEKFSDPAYLDRRIKECKKEIRDREKNIVHYEQTLSAIESGEEKKKYNGAIITAEEVTARIERELELVEKAMDKQGYLENCLDKLGGLRFNKDNIKVGYVIRVKHTEQAKIISVGPVNVSYKILTGGAAGMTLTAAYAEISEIIKGEEKKREAHPFKVGEQFTAVSRDYSEGFRNVKTTETVYEIVKASDATIQLKPVGTDVKPITRKPVKTYDGKWRFTIDDTCGSTLYKKEETQ
jgi:hypothetical protein